MEKSILDMTVNDFLRHANDAGAFDAINKFTAKDAEGKTVLVIAIAAGSAVEQFESDLDDYLAESGGVEDGPALECGLEAPHD